MSLNISDLFRSSAAGVVSSVAEKAQNIQGEEVEQQEGKSIFDVQSIGGAAGVVSSVAEEAQNIQGNETADQEGNNLLLDILKSLLAPVSTTISKMWKD